MKSISCSILVSIFASLLFMQPAYCYQFEPGATSWDSSTVGVGIPNSSLLCQQAFDFNKMRSMYLEKGYEYYVAHFTSMCVKILRTSVPVYFDWSALPQAERSIAMAAVKKAILDISASSGVTLNFVNVADYFPREPFTQTNMLASAPISWQNYLDMRDRNVSGLSKVAGSIYIKFSALAYEVGGVADINLTPQGNVGLISEIPQDSSSGIGMIGSISRDYYAITAHELLHEIGFAHETVKVSVMNPVLGANTYSLSEDDTAGLRFLLGERATMTLFRDKLLPKLEATTRLNVTTSNIYSGYAFPLELSAMFEPFGINSAIQYWKYYLDANKGYALNLDNRVIEVSISPTGHLLLVDIGSLTDLSKKYDVN